MNMGSGVNRYLVKTTVDRTQSDAPPAVGENL